MSGEGPPLKRAKNDTEEVLSFHKSQQLQILDLALSSMNNRLSGYGVGVMKIKVCDALSSKHFSKATCDCEELCKSCTTDGSTSIPEGYHLNAIFQHGFGILESYIRSPECLPQSKGARHALAKLLKFLTNIGLTENTLSHCRNDASETEWTVRVAHHLLSKLAISSSYILDDKYFRKRSGLLCPCGCEEKISGCYGDTSLGVPSYWYGRVDILMEVAVTTLGDKEVDFPGTDQCSCIENKCSSDRMVACKEQIRAEAIVFSFLQRRNHPDLDNFLIPTIAISKSQVAVCLYDSDNDIFLETPRLDLFIGDKFLKIETIITLWLVLNYRYCCSGIPEEILGLNFKADFYKHTGSLLEMYSDGVRAPCHYKPESTWLALPVLKNIKRKTNNVNCIYQPSIEKR